MKKKIYSGLLAIYCIKAGLFSGLLYGKDIKSRETQNSDSAIAQNLSEEEIAEFDEFLEDQGFNMEGIRGHHEDDYENSNEDKDKNDAGKNSIYSMMMEKFECYGLRAALVGLQIFWAAQDARESIKQKYSNSKIFLKKYMKKIYE